MQQSVQVNSPNNASFRDQAALHVVNNFVLARGTITTPGPQVPEELSVPRPSPLRPVCIIGAGCAGLYAAMMLQSLKIPYVILEANERVGGRVYTHRFNGEAGRRAPIGDPARYDYVDIGAMRFPNIPFMDPVFRLFTRLRMFEDGLMIEYKMSADHTFQMYNSIRTNDVVPEGEDIFHVSASKGGAVPDDYVAEGADAVSSAAFEKFADAFKTKPFVEAWKELTAEDHFSTRGYMLGQSGYPESVVEWLETFESATGLYNDAFVESVMDAIDFGAASATRSPGIPVKFPRKMRDIKPFDWYCIDGGTEKLVERMEHELHVKPQTGTKVIKMRDVGDHVEVMYVTSNGVPAVKEYSQVICTVPLGCVSAMDVEGCGLSYMQKAAVRSLNYDTSTKIALKFEHRWWEDPEVMGAGKTIKGGVSSTDLPIRTCVYPSYGFNCPNPPGVMLASYTWAQDAQRLGGLAQGKGSIPDKQLVDLTLDNLSKLHDIPIARFGKLVDHLAWNWHNDQYARGAFALFGPGQFGHADENSMFANMKAPAARGKLHFAGEATSAHHAWILGALNSAWRAVVQVIGPNETLLKELKEKWPVSQEDEIGNLHILRHLGIHRQL